MCITNFRPKILLDKDPQCKPKEQFNITKLQIFEKNMGSYHKFPNNMKYKGVQRLEEIWMCLNPDHQHINCPPISKCSNNFTFPPFPHLPCNTLK
ncbi:uncharacterized protein DC041_0011546 [Schistosoma bovis]|uniref:Uncharacterized protein n=1 Tax=Schistosoma bovis TaxID=6184 RepID=A0A430Q284_SCHBO|nr:uncharacterized protein DC041_0011546 [Schistosoma bovis]